MTKDATATDRADLIFKAFSDRTRLRILYLLRGGECCVGNVVEILQIEQPNASRHLAFLKKAGLVSVRRSAQWNYYSLAPADGDFHARILDCLACCFSEVPQLRTDQARAEEVRRAGGCCPGEQEEAPPEAATGGCCSGD
jgi:ArsR family transcriptional regulator, arsenate/arsenite/antimonite-responsive transcriptional repressor